MLVWEPITEFPGYSISDEGQVRNDTTGKLLSPSLNQFEVQQVGLMKDNKQYKRGVALLVAKEFLDPPQAPIFNTPINLDGDRTNNRVENLMWRPRWFAIMYHQQFHNGKRGFNKPIVEINSGEEFPDSWAAATKYGLLDREIMIATLNRTYVWPTYQEFSLIED